MDLFQVSRCVGGGVYGVQIPLSPANCDGRRRSPKLVTCESLRASMASCKGQHYHNEHRRRRFGERRQEERDALVAPRRTAEADDLAVVVDVGGGSEEPSGARVI